MAVWPSITGEEDLSVTQMKKETRDHGRVASKTVIMLPRAVSRWMERTRRQGGKEGPMLCWQMGSPVAHHGDVKMVFWVFTPRVSCGLYNTASCSGLSLARGMKHSCVGSTVCKGRNAIVNFLSQHREWYTLELCLKYLISGDPVVAQWKLIWLGSMRMQIPWGGQILASISGLRIQCCCDLWYRLQTNLGSGVAVAVAVT